MNKDELEGILTGLFPIVKSTNLPEKCNKLEHPRVSMSEIELALKQSAKRNPAPGPDGTTASAMKGIIKTLPVRTADVLDGCLSADHFPEEWKEAKLVLIKKEGKPDEKSSSYRPICLVNEISKTFERLIAQRIKIHLKERGPDLYKYQFGFRQGMSTTDAVIVVKKIINSVMERNTYIIGVSIDISNAFNSVRWKDIVNSMRSRRFPEYLCRIVNSYLCNRKIMCKNNEGDVIKRHTHCGSGLRTRSGPMEHSIRRSNKTPTSTRGSSGNIRRRRPSNCGRCDSGKNAGQYRHGPGNPGKKNKKIIVGNCTTKDGGGNILA